MLVKRNMLWQGWSAWVTWEHARELLISKALASGRNPWDATSRSTLEGGLSHLGDSADFECRLSVILSAPSVDRYTPSHVKHVR